MKKIHLIPILLTIMFFVSPHFCPAQITLETDKWHYIQVDDSRAKWGDWDDPGWLRYFGLDYTDINNDGYADLIAGRYFYRNPGGDMTEPWERIDLGFNVDGMLFANIDDDEYQDVISEALPDVYWFEAKDIDGNSWCATKIAELPKTGHVNGQGYLTADLIPGNKPELILAVHDGIYYAEIPADPIKDVWNFIRAAATASDEGFAVADLNGDSYPELIAGDRPEEGEEYTDLKCFIHPGDKSADWNHVLLGKTDHAIDRVRAGDFDQDGNTDIVISEERYPGKEPDASIYWFRNPGFIKGYWERNTIITQYSMNNLDTGDIDRDGDTDLVTNEHKGDELKTQLFINDGKGNFKAQTIDKGKESHLGTQFVDLDNDGDLDIVSVAWDNYRFLHVWRNDAGEDSRWTMDDRP